MVYLHKSVFQSHGYLSSTNCHVDSRWVLKVSGFAMHAFRNTDCEQQVNKSFFILLHCSFDISVHLQSPLGMQTPYCQVTCLYYRLKPQSLTSATR